jgi:hypothetical protein
VIDGVRIKKWAFVVAIVWNFSICCSTATAAEIKTPRLKLVLPPKRVTVPKLHAQIKIDGQLDEPVWTNAARLGPFVQSKTALPERERTEVRIWYDDQALYLGWICRDVDVQATLTNRDSKFWEEEVVEMFITSGSLTRYFELQWNPLGGVFDAIITNRLGTNGVSLGFDGDWGFTANGMTSAVKVVGTVNKSDDQDEFWQVETRVPFSDLAESTPVGGTRWRANFFRFNRTKDLQPEELSWSPTRRPGFHEPQRFGYLEFGK